MRSSLNVGSHDTFAPLTRAGYGVTARLQHALRLTRSARRSATAPLRLNLALQGGGAHGAFTWGALDRLLEDERIAIAAVSGASAGALNAVALADGLAAGGRDGARAKLAEIWRAIAEAVPFGIVAGSSPGFVAWDLMTRFFSPSQMNPFAVNPLRDILQARIDFRRVRREAPLELYLAATDVETGAARVFRRHEISAKAVLASCCLPQLMPPVRIAGRFYWDGGFSANPPLWPLIENTNADDTLVVLLDRRTAARVPESAPEIGARLSWLAFGQPLSRELASIERARAVAGAGAILGRRAQRRLLRHRLDFIEPGDALAGLDRASRLVPQKHVLEQLCEAGHATAETWLAERFGA
jgi:NTE family protein